MEELRPLLHNNGRGGAEDENRVYFFPQGAPVFPVKTPFLFLRVDLTVFLF